MTRILSAILDLVKPLKETSAPANPPLPVLPLPSGPLVPSPDQVVVGDKTQTQAQVPFPIDRVRGYLGFGGGYANMGGVSYGDYGAGGYIGAIRGFDGLLIAPEPFESTYYNFRRMKKNPVITIAMILANVAIKAGGWTYEERIGCDPLYKKFIDSQLKNWVGHILDQFTNARYDGFHAEEIVYTRGMWQPEAEDEEAAPQAPMQMFMLGEMKPLDPSMTQPVVDPSSGELLGCINYGRKLDRPNLAWFAHNAEAGDVFGQSDLSNIKRVYKCWEDLLTKIGTDMGLATGVFFMLEYPADTIDPVTGYPIKLNVMPDGSLLSNYEVALKIRTDLISGIGVVVPNDMSKYAEQILTSTLGVSDMAKLASWRITFPDTRSAHGADFNTLMTLCDSYVFSGLATPPRSGLESKHGSKADSSQHTESGIIVASEFFISKLIRLVVQPIIDILLVQNFGEEAKGAVWAEVKPLIDEKLQFVQQILLAMVSNPNGGLQLALKAIDILGNLDKCGVESLQFDQAALLDQIVKMQAVPPPGDKGNDPNAKPSDKPTADATPKSLAADPAETPEEARRRHERDDLAAALLLFWLMMQGELLNSTKAGQPVQTNPAWQPKLAGIFKSAMIPAAYDGAGGLVVTPPAYEAAKLDTAISDALGEVASRTAGLMIDARVGRIAKIAQAVNPDADGTDVAIKHGINGVMDELGGKKNAAATAEDMVFAGGEIGKYSLAGVLGATTQWVTQEDERVCKICLPLDGVIAPVGGEFAPGIRYPTVDTHPNCRCQLIYNPPNNPAVQP